MSPQCSPGARARPEGSRHVQPGCGCTRSGQTARYHDTCVAVAEAVLGIDLASSTKSLEESAADARYPLLQLYASFGLAAVTERSGNLERAGQVRDFLRRVAPHCAPLHANPREFVPSGERSDQRKEGPVSASLASRDRTRLTSAPHPRRVAGSSQAVGMCGYLGRRALRPARVQSSWAAEA